MGNVEFRSEGTYYEPRDEDVNQLALPIAIAPKREVYWLHGAQETKRRLFGQKVVTALVMKPGEYLPSETYMDTNDIAELADPNLRYALRFADAAESVGWRRTGPGMQSRHDVSIIATNEGAYSQLLSAGFSGVETGKQDTFMQNLYDQAPGLSD